MRVDASQFGQVLRDAKGFDKKLASGLRKNLRIAGAPAVADVKAVLAQPPPGGGKRSYGVRAALIRGTALRINAGQRDPGIRVTTSGAGLPAARKPMLRGYAKATWRHPVFGNRRVWVNQTGRPYFSVVIGARRTQLAAAAWIAVAEAAETMKGSP